MTNRSSESMQNLITENVSMCKHLLWKGKDESFLLGIL